MASIGSIYIIGIGPGGLGHLTITAKDALKKCDVVVGYKTYTNLISGIIKDKEVFSTGMTHEIERCQKAIEFAMKGKKVAVVSSGDSGIYGMAGLVLELVRSSEFGVRSQKSEVRSKTKRLTAHGSRLTVSIIPGVPAFCAAAAMLGAPIMHDFASISLSDLLTPSDVIEKRIDAAAGGDFIIILYNPKSKKRVTQLDDAIKIISRHRNPETPVGIVRNVSRDNEEVRITLLKDISRHYEFIDMTTVIIIGNSTTFISGDKIITPRGYTI